MIKNKILLVNLMLLCCIKSYSQGCDFKAYNYKENTEITEKDVKYIYHETFRSLPYVKDPIYSF